MKKSKFLHMLKNKITFFTNIFQYSLLGKMHFLHFNII